MNGAPAEKEPTKTVCLELPASVHREFKAKCAMTDRTQSSTLAALVTGWTRGKITIPGEE